MLEIDPRLEFLNIRLVDTFNEILKVEELSLRRATNETVTVTELHWLDAVAKDAQATILSLAAATRVTVSTMTMAVNRLEDKQYVERMRETANHRVVRVRLTEKGRAPAYVHKRFHRRMVRAVVKGLHES